MIDFLSRALHVQEFKRALKIDDYQEFKEFSNIAEESLNWFALIKKIEMIIHVHKIQVFPYK